MTTTSMGLRRLERSQNLTIGFTQLIFFFTGLLLLLFGILRIALEFGEMLTGVNNDALKSGIANWFTGETYTTPLVLLVGILSAFVGYGLLWACAALGAKEPPAWSAGYVGLIATAFSLTSIAAILIWLEVRFLLIFLLVLLLLIVASVVLWLRFNQADFRLALGAERIHRQSPPTYVWWIYALIVVGLTVLVVLGIVYAILTDVIELNIGDVPEGELIYLTTFDAFNDEWDIENATDSYTSAVIEPDELGNNRLVINLTPEAEQGVFTLLNRKLRNFDLRLTTTQLASDPLHDNAFGVIFGYRNDETYYQFQISGDGYYRLLKIAPNGDSNEVEIISDWRLTTAPDEDFEINNTNPTIIRPGSYNPINSVQDAQNEIRVIVRDQKFAFFVNGVPLPLCLKGTRRTSMWVGEGCVEGNIFTYTFEDPDYRQGKIGLFVDRTPTSDPSYPVTIAFDNIVIVGSPEQLDLPSIEEIELP